MKIEIDLDDLGFHYDEDGDSRCRYRGASEVTAAEMPPRLAELITADEPRPSHSAESDPVGTVRQWRHETAVAVKLAPGIWSVIGPGRSARTVPSSHIVDTEHPVIGTVPGLARADFVTAAATTASERFTTASAAREVAP